MRVVCITYDFGPGPARLDLLDATERRIRELGPSIQLTMTTWLLVTALSFSDLNDELGYVQEDVPHVSREQCHRLVLLPVETDSGWAIAHSDLDAAGEDVAEWLFQRLGDVG